MPHEDASTRLARQWLVKARQDLLTAEAVGDSPELLGAAAFHCQQAVEKALKAFLSFHARPFRRTHNLSELLVECIESDGAFSRFIGTAALLSPYVAVFRYPGLGEDPTSGQTAAAIRAAREVVAFVENLIPPPGPA